MILHETISYELQIVKLLTKTAPTLLNAGMLRLVNIDATYIKTIKYVTNCIQSQPYS